MKITVRKNDKLLQRKLEKAAKRNLPKVSSSAMEESLKTVQKEAQEKHKFKSRTGNLVNAIRISSERNSGKVFIDTSSATYAPFVVHGFSSFTIKGNPLHWTSGEKDIFARNAEHPGKEKDLFLTEALKNTRTEINNIFNKKLREESGLWQG